MENVELSTGHQVDVTQVNNNFNYQNNEVSFVDTLATAEEDATFNDNFDRSCTQLLRARQSLMREAVEWKVYAKTLLENGCSEGDNFYDPEILTSLKMCSAVADKAELLSHITEKDFMQPPVQFWDFQKVYEKYCNKRALLCPSCSMPLTFVPFVHRFALRMLYDLEKPVLLATSFLRCSNKGKKQHEILGYDPRLLRLFPFLDLPFMLFHKAGITKKLIEFSLANIIGGMTVNRLSDVVKTKYEVTHNITCQYFAHEIETVRNYLSSQGEEIKISDDVLFPPYVNCHPSKALLGRCFLAAFQDKNEYYKYCMQKLCANECIVLDDTLSINSSSGVATTCGDVKLFPDDFEGFFLVLNESKHVLSWSFLREHTFTEVEETLSEIKNRHLKENIVLKACFTTKCCEWKEELRKLFGKWFIVKGNLRLFIDQIIHEIPHDHPYYQECVNELVTVFRKNEDTEDVRKEYTADPVTISNNIQEFVKRWGNVVDDRFQAVLSEKVLLLINELETHIHTGCLSEIPPKVGDDNFNDIHNALHKSISRCRITLPLVSALFSMCLHEINRSKGANVEFQYGSDTAALLPTVTTSFDTPDTPINATSISIQTEIEKDQFPASSKQLQILPASIVIETVNKHYRKQNEAVPLLLRQSLMYYKYREDFDAFSPRSVKPLRMLPYYSSALNLISHPSFKNEDKVHDIEMITKKLSSLEQKIRHLQVLPFHASLTGNFSDVFTIISKQLLKDKIYDNLSVDSTEYVKHLISVKANVNHSYENDALCFLKRIIDYEPLSSQQNEDIDRDVITIKLKEDAMIEKDAVIKEDEIIYTPRDVVKGDSGNDRNIWLKRNTQKNDKISKLKTKDQNTLSLNEVDSKSEVLNKIKTRPSDQLADSLNGNQLEFQLSRDDEIKLREELRSTKVIDEATVSIATNDEVEQHDETVELQMEVQNEAVITSDFLYIKKLADKLGAVVTIFTNLEHFWFVPIFPEVFTLSSPHLFLIYRFQRFFPAWLNNRASVTSVRNINLKRQGKDPQCRCGRGTQSKVKGQSRCVSKIGNGKYLTRCICFRLSRGCSVNCDCKCCENPFGLRPAKSKQRKLKIPYRQRYAHEAAKLATCRSSSSAISTQTRLNSAGEEDLENIMSKWVPIDHCIFESVINELKSDGANNTLCVIQETFNDVVKQIRQIDSLQDFTSMKTLNEITQKLAQRDLDVTAYLNLYQEEENKTLLV